MNKFLTLLKKEYLVNKRTILIPIWIVLGFYVLNLIGYSIAHFQGNIQWHFLNIKPNNFSSFDSEETELLKNIISYLGGIAQMGLPGVLGIIFSLTISQGALNDGKRRNCEMFHRSQPVSEWLISGAKYINSIVVTWIPILLICIFNLIVLFIALSHIHEASIYYALLGTIQSFLSFFLVGMLISSFAFFCSAVFDEKAFLKAFLSILGLQLIIVIFNKLYSWNLPNIIGFIFKSIFKGFNNLKSLQYLDSIENVGINNLVAENWNLLFSWNTAAFIVVSAIFFVSAALIYKFKEIK